MTRLFVDTDKYAEGEGPPIVEAFHGAIKDLVRRRLEEHHLAWEDFVFDRACELVGAEDVTAIERRLLDGGYRYAWSAVISAQERPEAYKPVAGTGDTAATFSFEHPEARTAPADANGRMQRGQGDNVVRHSHNAVGVACYVRSSEQVLRLLERGVPADTIAVIDDSGGTLTAPVLGQFKGVICAGGTVRSHLGILTREYGIPCLMNARISGIRDGDRVELETSAAARTAESYQSGVEMSARIWKLPA